MKPAYQYALDRIRAMAPPNGDQRMNLESRLGPMAQSMAASGAGDIVDRMAVLPFGKDTQGNVDVAVPQMAVDAYDAFMMPGRIMQGQQFTNDEMQSAAFDLVGVGMGGAGLTSAPRDALTTFGGITAKTADQAALQRAEQMLAAGDDAADIWRSTGWWKGPDDKWRFEIDDSASQMRSSEQVNEIISSNSIAAEEMRELSKQMLRDSKVQPDLFPKGLNAARRDLRESADEITRRPYGYRAEWLSEGVDHPDLFAAYPELRGYTYNREPYRGDGLKGSYNDKAVTTYGGQQRSIALHEMDHAVQELEGFARGGSPDSATSDLVSRANDRLADISRQMDEIVGSRGYRDFSADPERGAALAAEYDELMEFRSKLNSPEARMQAYRQLFGEVEARAVQSRMDMTPSERRATPPWESMDVAPENWVVRGLLK